MFFIEGRQTKIEKLFVDEGREAWERDKAGNKVFIKTYFVKGQWVAVASTQEIRNGRPYYAYRWRIEIGFQALKKRGLNIEDTGLKDPICFNTTFGRPTSSVWRCAAAS